MKRREFTLISGGILSAGLAPSMSRDPALGLSLEISSVRNIDPSDVDTITVDITSFDIKPKYVDVSNNFTITVRLEVADHDNVTDQTVISLQNGGGSVLDDIGDLNPVVKKGISTSKDVLPCDLVVKVEHPQISEVYRRRFNISPSDLPSIVVDSDRSLSPGVYDYDNVIVKSGNTLTLEGDPVADSNGNFGGVRLNANQVVVESNAKIVSNGEGYGRPRGEDWNGGLTSQGPGYGHDRHRCGAGLPDGSGGGGSYGGSGGRGYAYIRSGDDDPSQVFDSGGTYGSQSNPSRLGSAGGNGCHSGNEFPPGGGSIFINTDSSDIQGSIEANGGNGSTSPAHGSGGGSGGSIRLKGSITGSGQITANGGDGGKDGGGGGGGRISLIDGNLDSNISLSADGGSGRGDGNNGSSGSINV